MAEKTLFLFNIFTFIPLPALIPSLPSRPSFPWVWKEKNYLMVMSRKEDEKNSRKRKRKTTILNATSVTLISYLILHLFLYTI